jgi:PAS domain-containing protein
VQLYFEKYAKLDPTTAGYFFAETEEPIATGDVMPYDEFLETRFYEEWARPQGLVDSVNAVLERSALTAACFVVFRHRRDGLVDDETRRRMRLVVPHVRRAALIGKALDLKKAEAATFADTLDGISAGMFLVDATGRIVHANAAGNVMLNGADVLHSAGGRLIANDRQADHTLADAFARAGDGDAAIGIKGIGVPLIAGDLFLLYALRDGCFPVAMGGKARGADRPPIIVRSACTAGRLRSSTSPYRTFSGRRRRHRGQIDRCD